MIPTVFPSILFAGFRAMRLKFFFLVTTIFVLVTFALGSTPVTRSWGKLIDVQAGLNVAAQAIYVDANGNVYAVSSAVEGNQSFIHVMKFDPYGTLLWKTPLTFTAGALMRGVCADSDGNVIVAGSIVTQTGRDVAVMKLYANGGPAWIRTKDGLDHGDDEALAVTTDSSNNIYVGASLKENLHYSAVRLALSPTGTYLDQITVSTLAPKSMTFSSLGSLVVCGYKSAGSSSASAVFLVITLSGTQILGEEYDNTSSERHDYLAATDPKGQIYLATTHYVFTGDSGTVMHTLKAFNKAGSMLWSTSEKTGSVYVLCANDESHVYADVLVDNVEKVRAYGASGSFKWEKTHAVAQMNALLNSGVAITYVIGQSSAYNIGLIKYDAAGNVDWQTTYSPANNGESAPRTSVTRDGELYVLGTGDTGGTSDLLLLKYTQGVAISAMGLSLSDVNGGNSVQGSVSINSPAPAGGFNIQLISSVPGVVGVPSQLFIPQGSTFAKFTAGTAVVDQLFSGVVYARASGVQRFATTLVHPATLQAVTVPSTTVQGGTKVTGTVKLTFKTGLSGRYVALSSTDTTAATVPSSVYVPPGLSSATFTIIAKSVSANKSVTINAKLSSVTKSVVLTVQH